jgi:hypothetical protein
MQEAKRNRCIEDVLLELRQVLCEEHTALVALDNASIDATNKRKAGLESELATFARSHFVTKGDRLISIKQQLQENLVLLVQARDLIQHRLGIESPPTLSHRASAPAASGNRLNLRG